MVSLNKKQNAADIDHSHEHDANPDQSPQILKGSRGAEVAKNGEKGQNPGAVNPKS